MSSCRRSRLRVSDSLTRTRRTIRRQWRGLLRSRARTSALEASVWPTLSSVPRRTLGRGTPEERGAVDTPARVRTTRLARFGPTPPECFGLADERGAVCPNAECRARRTQSVGPSELSAPGLTDAATSVRPRRAREPASPGAPVAYSTDCLPRIYFRRLLWYNKEMEERYTQKATEATILSTILQRASLLRESSGEIPVATGPSGRVPRDTGRPRRVNARAKNARTGRARYVVRGLSPEDAADRARTLPDASRYGTRLKVEPKSKDLYVVRFAVAPTPPRHPVPKALTHSLCLECGHEREDHYRGYCQQWGCPTC